MRIAFASIAFASTLGVGVLFSSVIVLIYQGSISLLGGRLSAILSDTMKGIACGTSITGLPQGITTHSTQCWFKTSAVNCDLVDWGQEGGGFNKVQIRVISPPRIYIDGNFASVTGNISLTQAQWHQVVHTYDGSVTRIYVDGQLDNSANVSMNLPYPSRMWIGGWYDGYAYAGDMDEVRVSNVTRSANWIKMEYENQKPLQTLVGNLVQTGSTFSVTPASVTMNEGGLWHNHRRHRHGCRRRDQRGLRRCLHPRRPVKRGGHRQFAGGLHQQHLDPHLRPDHRHLGQRGPQRFGFLDRLLGISTILRGHVGRVETGLSESPTIYHLSGDAAPLLDGSQG